MATEAQIIANRRNAQKSTGPRSTQGKSIVSQNAVTHGLSAHQDVIASESQPLFEQFRAHLLDELCPEGPLESVLAERIVSLSWRLSRTAHIQNQTIDALQERNTETPFARLTKSMLKSLDLPGSDSDPSPHLALGRLAVKDFSNARVLERLLMYERRIEHSLFKTMLELQRHKKSSKN